MTADYWEKIRAIFHAALDVEPERRAEFLLGECPDPQTRMEVEDLLRSVGTDDFLETPAFAKAREFITAAGDDETPGELEGVVLGERYQLRKMLARGGHALVFTATDLRLPGRRVVVKILDCSAEHQTWLQRRFRGEIEILGRINHPGVVGIHDCGETALGQPYLVMDFIDGITLRQLIGKGIRRGEVAVIAEQMGASMRAAHAQGVFHRDLKPENVMIQKTSDEAGLRVTLIDFGIAQVERAETKGTTTVLMIAGTVKYMAPEQFLGVAVAESDIYAMAVVCFEMLTGHPPHHASDSLELANERRNQLPEQVVNRSEVPLRVRPLLAGALDIDLKKRPADAEAFGRDVAEALRRPEPGWPTRVGLLVATSVRRPVVATALAMLVVVLAGVAWLGLRAPAGFGQGVAGQGQIPAGALTRVNAVDGLTYVSIPAGTFPMGCSPGDAQCFPDEKPNMPQTEQIVARFWLGRTEVTQAAWSRVRGANPSHFRGDQLPVENVSWVQANDYCSAIGGRLPTEKEWEYAARAGSLEPLYGRLDAIAWHAGNSAGTTHPAGLRQPNAFGLYDMLGNVWEWTSDESGPGARSVRGGSWVDGDRFVRVSVRYRGIQEQSNYNLGFRCTAEFL